MAKFYKKLGKVVTDIKGYNVRFIKTGYFLCAGKNVINKNNPAKSVEELKQKFDELVNYYSKLSLYDKKTKCRIKG